MDVKLLAYQKFQQMHVINCRNVVQNLELQVLHQFSHQNVDRCSYIPAINAVSDLVSIPAVCIIRSSDIIKRSDSSRG